MAMAMAASSAVRCGAVQCSAVREECARPQVYLFGKLASFEFFFFSLLLGESGLELFLAIQLFELPPVSQAHLRLISHL